MATSLKANFEQYCRDYQSAVDELAGNEEAQKPEEKKPEYELYQKLKEVNGKKGDELVSAFLSQVFDEDTKKIEQHLLDYLQHLLNDNVLKQRDINQGLSRFSDLLPELVLDCPQIHKYLMNFLIKPLREKNIVSYQHISWKFEKIKKEDDEDDIQFGTEPFFKLLALILVDMKRNQMSWKDICKNFDKFNWREPTDDKHQHIEEADSLWSEIKNEIGDSAASVVIPLLNMASDPAGMEKKLQDALKNQK